MITITIIYNQLLSITHPWVVNLLPKKSKVIFTYLQINIGQICSYSNQCPENAYCQGTCQCPDNYYVDLTAGTCTASQGYQAAAGCTYTYQCNKIQRLSCISSKCDCEPVSMYWDSTFSNGGGAITGRCANKKGVGKASTATTQGISGVALGIAGGSFITVAVCYCDYTKGYKLNFDTGLCDAEYYEHYCHSSLECRVDGSFCMAIYSDSIKRCIAFPTKFWLNVAYTVKGVYGGTCNSFNPCNEFQNLICSKYYQNSASTGTCRCFNKYYYSNTTMCVYGTRYGETCTSVSSCVPGTAGMVNSFNFKYLVTMRKYRKSSP